MLFKPCAPQTENYYIESLFLIFTNLWIRDKKQRIFSKTSLLIKLYARNTDYKKAMNQNWLDGKVL